MNMKRMRGRNHRPNGGGGGGGGGGSTGSGFRNQQNGIPLNRNHVFDSSGPEMRVRGTAQQLYDKYQQMARDASSNGDRVLGESYYQHAEHYFRIISAINQASGQPNPQPNTQAPYQGSSNQGGQNGYQNGQSDQNRRSDYNGQDSNNNGNGHGNGNGNGEQQNEARSQEPRQEYRAPEQRNQEPRQQDTRPQEARAPQQPRVNEPRREQRSYEPRNRQDNPRPERYRSDTPVVDTRIDISSALEAELAATITPAAGYGEQPSLLPDMPPQAAPAPKPIRIIPVAPPAVVEVPVKAPAKAEPVQAEPVQAEAVQAETVPAEPVRVPRPRGRPRLVKPAPAKTDE